MIALTIGATVVDNIHGRRGHVVEVDLETPAVLVMWRRGWVHRLTVADLADGRYGLVIPS